MSEYEFRFRSEEAEDMPDYGALPDGKHLVQISSVELRDTQKGGKRLVLGLTAQEGDLTGIATMVGLNVVCPGSPKAEAISRSQLKKLSQAIGRPDWDDVRVLRDEYVIANLKLKPARTDPYEGKEYPPSNEVRGFFPVEQEVSEASDTIPFPKQSEAPQAPTLPKTEEVIAKSEELPWNK